MKKSLLFLILLLIVFLPCFVYAGDTDQWIEAGDQDAFIICKVTDYKDNLYFVHVEKVLMGEMDSIDVKVEKSSTDLPKYAVGKFFVMSLDRKDTVYKVKHGAYMVKHGTYTANNPDYRALKLEYAASYNINGRIEKFINDGKFIEADKEAKEKKNNALTFKANTNQETAAINLNEKFIESVNNSYVQWVFGGCKKF